MLMDRFDGQTEKGSGAKHEIGYLCTYVVAYYSN